MSATDKCGPTSERCLIAGISGLLCIYRNDDSVLLRSVLDALVAQSRPLDELVVVLDGPVGDEHVQLLNDYSADLSIREVQLAQNCGLGSALAHGVTHCRFEYVMRIDADDLSAPERAEVQEEFLDKESDIAAVGAWITEFEEVPENIVIERRLPIDPDALYRYSKRRSPLNHTAVMLRRSAVLAVGNYAPYRKAQDYHLWVRLLSAGYRVANIPRVLVNVYSGASVGERRGGMERLRIDIQLQREFLSMGFITQPEFLSNCLMRVAFRLMPKFFRRLIYQSAWQ